MTPSNRDMWASGRSRLLRLARAGRDLLDNVRRVPAAPGSTIELKAYWNERPGSRRSRERPTRHRSGAGSDPGRTKPRRFQRQTERRENRPNQSETADAG